VALALRGYIALPSHGAGDFDHGDVHLNTGRVFVAHTANDTLEVIDGERLELRRTVPGCPEGSGVHVLKATIRLFSRLHAGPVQCSCWTP